MGDFVFHVFIEQAAWWASGLGLFQLWKMGDRKWWAPFVGMFTQIPWFTLAIVSKQYGLIPASLAYFIVHARNARRWYLLSH